MDIVFSKITENRKECFKIITDIISIDNKLYVRKRGTSSSINHIKSIFDNASLLETILPKYIDKPRFENNAFVAPYFSGNPIAYYFTNGEEEKAIKIFEEIINKIPTKKFSEFKNDKERFYKVKFSNDELSFSITNYDLTFFNIIKNNDEIKIIDYEWVFDYPIPKNAVIYRALKQIKTQYPNSSFSLEKWCHYFKIKDIDKYEELENEFQRYVLSDFSYRNVYRKEERFFDANVNYTELNNESNLFRQENENLKKEKDEKENQIKQLNSDLNDRYNEKRKLEKDLDDYIYVVRTLRSDINDREYEIKTLKNDLEGKKESFILIQNEIKAKEKEVELLKENSELKDDKINVLQELAEKSKVEIDSLKADVATKESEITSLEDNISSKEKVIDSLKADVATKESEITSLEDNISSKEKVIDSLKDNLKDKEEGIKSLESNVASKENEISSLEDNICIKEGEIEALKGEIREKEENIRSLQDSNSKLNDNLSAVNIKLQNTEENVKKLNQEKEDYKSKSENYENSTTFKLMKPYWKVRDWLVPKNSKRRLFLKLLKKAIRHPIWTIKHLNRRNIRKFNKYLKSEGPERCLERIQIFEVNNQSYDDFNLELFDMKPRDNYPELIMPYFKNPLVSIIIPVYNQFPYTYGCLESILKNTRDISYQIIIGDDCSTDETAHLEDYVKNVVVLHNKKNLRFLLNCNNAAKYATGQYVLFLNNDTNVQANWLASLLETININPKYGMVGSKLVYPDGRLQEAGGILWKDGSAWNFGYKGDITASEYNYRKPVDYISGAAIMLSKKLWNSIGGFDEHFVPAYCEDSDLAFEVRKAGYEVIYDPFSVVVHYEGVSNGTDVTTGVKKYQVENSKKLYEKWKDVLATHPDNAVDVFKARERNYGKKTILVVDHYVPEFDKDAGSRTVFDYLNIFVDLGFSVKFLGENFYKSEPYTDILEKRGIEVLYGPYYANNYKLWLKENGKYFDYVFMNRPHITAKFIDSIIESCPNAKFIYYGHDLHFVRLLREYEISKDKSALLESDSWKKMELSIYDKVDLIYYPSKIEQDEIKKIKEDYNVKVLQPYVYKPNEYHYDPNKRNDLLFVGGFRHGANFDGIKWFIKEIFPDILKKDNSSVLKIAGSFPPQELLDMQNENIKVLGFVSDEELEKLYSEAKLIVAPLRFGAGIKGKIIEAMNHNVPVITTDVGAEGIDNTAIVVDNKFDSLVDLYNDNKKLSNLSKLEKEFIDNNYSYDSAVKKLVNDFEELDKIKR